MMTNKWVQVSLLFGFTVGLWVSAWMNLIHPFASFFVAYALAIPTLWLLGRARGTAGPADRRH